MILLGGWPTYISFSKKGADAPYYYHVHPVYKIYINRERERERVRENE